MSNPPVVTTTGEQNQPSVEAVEPKFSLHPDDPKNFLKLSTALTLLVKKTITAEEVEKAQSLLCAYCVELIMVWHIFLVSFVC
jgi:hypothetical protein